MQRINVVGTSASGKSAFSKQLAEKLKLEYIELDDLFWMDNWQETSDTEFLKKIEQSIAQAKKGYVIDGNYSQMIPVKWKDIDTVIWLDIPFYTNIFQAVKRALNRALFQTQLWGNSNNTENFRQMFSRDSIVLWMIKTHQKNRKEYLKIMRDPQYAHIQFIHLKSRVEIERFLQSVD